MDTDSFIIHIKTEDFYKDTADDVEKRFDTSSYECNRPLAIGENKRIIGLIKDKLGEKNMTQFVALRPKTYSYLMNHDYVIIMSRTRFRLNPHPIVARMSRNSLHEAGVKSEV